MVNRTKKALSLFQQGKQDEALALLKLEISRNSHDAFAFFLAAVIYAQQTSNKAAIAYFKEALVLQPVYPEALNNLGVVYEAVNDSTQAKICYENAIKQKKGYANAYYNLANILKAEKNFDSAIENYLTAIKYNPNYSNALNNLGLVYQYLGNFTKSHYYFQKSLTIVGNDPEVLNNLGFNYYCLHQYAEALKIYQNILSNIPNYAPTLLNMGMLFQAIENYDAARDYFKQLISHPDYAMQAKNNLAYLELSVGNYPQGWHFYRARPSMRNTNISSPDKLPANLSNKKILLYKDQGIGDEVFFSRYIPVLQNSGANLSYYCDKKLIAIWQHNLADIDILIEKPNTQNFDYTVSIADLPELLLKNEQSHLPDSIQLKPDNGAIQRVENLLPQNTKPNIAVSWEAGVRGHNMLYKQIPPDQLGKSLASLDANILVIQRNAKAKDIKALENNLGRKTFNYTYLNDNLEEMLAMLSLVDEYVCVSNTNFHLLNSLNRPANVLIPYPPEWRWTNIDGSSPWFPLARTFRQDSSGNWQDALNKLNKVLEYHISN